MEQRQKIALTGGIFAMFKTFIDEKGFTYLEAMIVVIVFGLFSAMALPALENRLAKEQLKMTARTITMHLRELQQLAISREEALKIIFTPGNFDDSTDSESYYQVLKGTKKMEQKTLPDGVVIEYVTFRDEVSDGTLTYNTLIFYPLGTASPGHIRLTNRQGHAFYVIVNSVGRVRTSDVSP